MLRDPDVVPENDRTANASRTPPLQTTPLFALFPTHNFLSPQLADASLVSTPLGDASTFAQMTSRNAVVFQGELDRALKSGICLSNDLHLIYLCAPLDVDALKIDWARYLKIFKCCDSEQLGVAKLVGVSEAFLQDMVDGCGMDGGLMGGGGGPLRQ